MTSDQPPPENELQPYATMARTLTQTLTSEDENSIRMTQQIALLGDTFTTLMQTQIQPRMEKYPYLTDSLKEYLNLALRAQKTMHRYHPRPRRH